MENKSFYDRLGLPNDASPEEIRHAYRQLVLHLHPDTNVNRGETELFMGIQQAYEHLSDPEKKAEYDQQLSVDHETQSPLWTNVLYSQPSLANLAGPQLIYALVELNLHPDTSLLVSTTPLNLCLVVDCSTSMRGLRLDTVKQTAIELIRQLHPNDIFSLVKFDDRAELLIPAGRLHDQKSTEMKIQLLQAGGGTEIFKGMEMGFSQVSRFRSNDHVNHIILITDGRTYGDEALCEQLAGQAATLGIGISTLGIGSQWNDKFLDRVSTKTGGLSKYIHNAAELRSTLLDEISRIGSNLTEHIHYTYSTSPKVELNSAFRLVPEAAPLVLGSPLIFGYMPRRGAMSILLEFLVKDVPTQETTLRLSKGFLNYEIPRHPSKTQYVQRLVLERPITAQPSATHPPQEILNAINILSLIRMQERAREEVARGELSSATQHLEILATHLLKQGENDLANSILDEVAYIQHNRSYSEDGEKRLKYATRSLLLPARTEENER